MTDKEVRSGDRVTSEVQSLDRRAVTSHDVARLAGVSQSTVSRALRASPTVSANTRRRVVEAAQRLNYVVSDVGRSLATRSRMQVGMVTSELTNPFYPHLVAPAQEELQRAGYRMVLFAEEGDDLASVNRLLDQSIDGVILTTSTAHSALAPELARRGTPFVFLNREVKLLEADACVVDNPYGARLVADALVDLGHRSIAAIFGPEDTSTGHERERAFAGRLSEHGVPLPSQNVRHGPFSYASGYNTLTELLGSGADFTAVFCANDVVAMGALSSALAHGVDVPGDLSIIGFDDIPMSSWNMFHLTTVHTDLDGMARAACRLLLDRIATPERAVERVVFTPEFVPRGTHGPARS